MKTFRIIAGVLLLIFGIAYALGTLIGSAMPTSGTTTTIQSKEKMTLEKFNKIKPEMTYQQVVDIIGEEGTLSTESTFGGQTMQIYGWYASDGISNANVTFMNGKVQAKGQLGLK